MAVRPALPTLPTTARLQDAEEQTVRISCIADAPDNHAFRRLGVGTTSLQRVWVMRDRGNPETFRLLAGAIGVRRAVLAGHSTVRAVVSQNQPHDFAESCRAADERRSVGDLITLATAMREHAYIPDRQIGLILGVTAADACRYRDLAGATPELRHALEAGTISMGHARYLIPLDHDAQRELLSKAINAGWSVKALAVGRKACAGDGPSKAPTSSKDADVLMFEERLSKRLGTTLTITGNQVEITWHSVEELLGVFEQLIRAPEPALGYPPAGKPRKLALGLTSLDELDAVLGHLYPQD